MPPAPTRATVWTEPFRIRAYEAGPDERASVLTVCDLFQEAAGEQARAHGLDVFDLPGGRATWVLSRLRVALGGPLPRLRERVAVETWPSRYDGLRAHRDFVLRDADARAVVRATSVWFLLDVARRRPVRLPPAMDHFLVPDVPRALTLDGVPPPAAPAEAAREERFAVRHADLDRVGHANHVRFAEWALEAVPGPVRSARHLAGLDLLFQAETVAGDVAVSACGPAGPEPGGTQALAHRISRETDGRTLALARSVWR